jgi:peptide/nickel transport system substrate-binding protein
MKKTCIAVLAVLAAAFPIAAQASADPQPIKGNVLRIGTSEDLDSLSPFNALERAATELFLLAYDSLTSFDDKLEPKADLAESWTTSADGLTWTFKLRKGIKWSDGAPFTSKDVKFTYDAVGYSGIGLYGDFLKGIKSIETPDDLTVVINTVRPKANLLQNPTPIVPEHVWKGHEKELETWVDPAMVGTGPFKFREWKKGQYYSLAANPKYFGGAPKVSGVVFSIFANRETLAQAIVNGEIDAALNLYPDQLKQIEKAGTVKAFVFSGNGFTQLALNCFSSAASKGNPVLRDKRVRQAIDTAIDRNAIVDIAFGGGGLPASTLIPPANPGWHYEPTSSELRSYSPAKAAALLDAAGFSRKGPDGTRLKQDGKPLSIRLFARSDNSREVKAAQMIEGYLKAVGIALKLSTIDDGALGDAIASSDFDMFIWGWGGDVDPTTLLAVLTTAQIDGNNETRFSDPAYDKMVDEQYSVIDSGARHKLVYEAQKLAYDEAPFVILTYDGDIQAVRMDKVRNLAPIAGGPIFYANTNVNYLRAAPVSGGSGLAIGGIVALIVAAALVIALAIFLVRRGKKGGKISWNDK